ncbi:MAG TPA: hypothetical protein VN915_09080 [Elusimicrobiota bacterium]|nr:hypothetical protein [Elusimicrobiota bacterium]
MNRINPMNVLAALALATPSFAAFVPTKIPTLTVLPITGSAPAAISFPSVTPSPLLPAPALPSPSLPVNMPRALPGAWNHQAVELPAQPAVPVPQPAHDTYHLDWSFLDGGHDVAHVAAPVGPAPLPLPPAGAAAQLAFAADQLAQGISAVEDAIFDHALAHPRLTVR